MRNATLAEFKDAKVVRERREGAVHHECGESQDRAGGCGQGHHPTCPPGQGGRV